MAALSDSRPDRSPSRPPSTGLSAVAEMAGALNTQNLHWANDKSKFGYRMLQKMGWSEGKGLGLKENGSVEHVRMRKRPATTGIGAVSSVDGAWAVPAQVVTGLNDVLARLAPMQGEGREEERNGEEGKARGYYERRVARKNVKNYSKSDLREIFGGAERATEADRMLVTEEGRAVKRGVQGKRECEGEVMVYGKRVVEVKVEKLEVDDSKRGYLKKEVDGADNAPAVHVGGRVDCEDGQGSEQASDAEQKEVGEQQGQAEQERRDRKRLRKLERKIRKEKKRRKAKRLEVPPAIEKSGKEHRKKKRKAEV